MPVLSENKCVSTQFELSIRCIEAERERFPKEYICTKMLTATAPCILPCAQGVNLIKSKKKTHPSIRRRHFICCSFS